MNDTCYMDIYLYRHGHGRDYIIIYIHVYINIYAYSMCFYLDEEVLSVKSNIYPYAIILCDIDEKNCTG